MLKRNHASLYSFKGVGTRRRANDGFRLRLRVEPAPAAGSGVFIENHLARASVL